MKYLFVSCLLILLPSILSAQSIYGVKLKDLEVSYIRIIERVAADGFATNDYRATIDYDLGGRYLPFSKRQGYLLKDANGQDVVFAYAMDALSFFTQNGFEFVQAYSVPGHINNSNYIVTFYLLKKKR